jgi:hypothetical protein
MCSMSDKYAFPFTHPLTHPPTHSLRPSTAVTARIKATCTAPRASKKHQFDTDPLSPLSVRSHRLHTLGGIVHTEHIAGIDWLSLTRGTSVEHVNMHDGTNERGAAAAGAAMTADQNHAVVRPHTAPAGMGARRRHYSGLASNEDTQIYRLSTRASGSQTSDRVGSATDSGNPAHHREDSDDDDDDDDDGGFDVFWGAATPPNGLFTTMSTTKSMPPKTPIMLSTRVFAGPSLPAKAKKATAVTSGTKPLEVNVLLTRQTPRVSHRKHFVLHHTATLLDL